jgi:hypothetical protein
MRAPSLKTLRAAFPRVEAAQLAQVRAAILGTPYGTPRAVERTLAACDVALSGHGVESISGRAWRRFWMDACLVYVNLGDTYTRTIVYDTAKDSFQVCAWGDVVERYPNRFSE